MGDGQLSIEPFGDAAVLIRVGDRVDAALAARAQAIAAALDDARRKEPALGRAVPAHASVLVVFAPLRLAVDDAVGIARDAVGAPAGRPGETPLPAIEIAVRYG